jgi:RNA polymerase sigma-70 factor (ECF subfamily)
VELVNKRSWLQRVRQGDEAAWEDIVRQHQEGVFRLAYLHLGDAVEAEDIAQRTFIRAFENAHRFDGERPMRPWLLSITVNLAKNRRRSLGRYWAALRRFGEQVLRPSSSGADPRWPSDEGRIEPELWEAVQHLSYSDREIIYLRFFLEMSVAESAHTLNIAPGTVKSRLHRALKRLREVIESQSPDLQGGTDGG